MEEFDYKAFQAKALEQLKSGKPLLGKDGAFAPLLENILNAALEGEMDAHLDQDERSLGNRRNGRMSKQVQTQLGEVTVHTPRDRHSSFEPEFIKKRETILAEGVADRIIGLYALGNSTREISDWMEKHLGDRFQPIPLVPSQIVCFKPISFFECQVVFCLLLHADQTGIKKPSFLLLNT